MGHGESSCTCCRTRTASPPPAGPPRLSRYGWEPPKYFFSWHCHKLLRSDSKQGPREPHPYALGMPIPEHACEAVNVVQQRGVFYALTAMRDRRDSHLVAAGHFWDGSKLCVHQQRSCVLKGLKVWVTACREKGLLLHAQGQCLKSMCRKAPRVRVTPWRSWQPGACSP